LVKLVLVRIGKLLSNGDTSRCSRRLSFESFWVILRPIILRLEHLRKCGTLARSCATVKLAVVRPGIRSGDLNIDLTCAVLFF
jgi:hypothetical protein